MGVLTLDVKGALQSRARRKVIVEAPVVAGTVVEICCNATQKGFMERDYTEWERADEWEER